MAIHNRDTSAVLSLYITMAQAKVMIVARQRNVFLKPSVISFEPSWEFPDRYRVAWFIFNSFCKC